MRKKNIFRALKIRTRIILVYTSVLIFSLALTVGILSMINNNRMEREISDAAMQTVNALNGNLDVIFENVTQFSDLIYFDKNVQEALSKSRSSGISPEVQQTIQKSLANMLLSGDYIYSIFIFDNYNNYYISYKEGPILVNTPRVKKSKWYSDLKKANGNVLFINKSEDVLSFPMKQDKNYISLVREISDINTYEQLAVLMINIDEASVQSYFDEIGEQYDSRFSIIDSENNYIIKPSNYEKKMDEYILSDENNKADYRTAVIDNKKTIIVKKDLGIADWKLISVLNIASDSNSIGKYYRNWIVLVICLNLIFAFACSVFLTRLIFRPLNKIQKHMKLAEGGLLMEMPLDNEYSNEINDLKRVFNQMIGSIETLINKVKTEEKIIARNELNILQAQINPHFLYNTLDAVSALALLKDNENCLKMTQALGNFYRNSLSSGQDLITVRNELECIESYITILNIRYDNKIILEYDIEEEIKDYLILKLILQPVVENAAHHGIRNKKGKGKISIKGYRDEDEIIFIITDDGMGMSEDRISEILEGKTQKAKSGFGLYSSIQRISLYYDIDKPVTITSEIGNGTEVTIRVKAVKGADSDED